MIQKPGFQLPHGIKRGRICDWPEDAASPSEIADQVTYGGNAMHKTYPSPAGPPAFRSDKAKCDHYAIADWPRLLDALKLAIRSGCVGSPEGQFPARAWVWINHVLHEARLTNAQTGEYHGFPVD